MTATIRVGCIGLPSSSLPPMGIEGVAVWPLSSAEGHLPSITRVVRRRLMWRTAIRSMPQMDRIVLCDPPKWAVAKVRNLGGTVTVAADPHAALRALATATVA